MSSIFTGLLEYIKTELPASQQPLPKQAVIVIGQVLDILNDEDVIQGAFEESESGDLKPELVEFSGVIRYKKFGADSNKYETEVPRFAFPANKGNMRVPIPGELVLIINGLSPSSVPERRVSYYLNILTGANIIRSAIKPTLVTPIDKVERSVLGITQELNQEALQKRFEKKIKHLPRTITDEGKTISNMREGDMIIEGRFGGAIRFTSTIKKDKAWSNDQMSLLDKSNDGDPLVIITNTQAPPVSEDTKDKSKPTLIDNNPSMDQSSIYLTTTQNIPIEIKTSRRLAQTKTGFIGSGLGPWEFDITRTLTGTGGTLVRETDASQRLQSFFPGEYDPNFVVTATVDVPYVPSYNDSFNANPTPGGPGETSPVPITGPASTRQEQLVKQALEASFANGTTKHMCARGTFNHANNYALLVKGMQPLLGMNVSAGGNANGAGFHDHMVQIGYTRYNITNIPKQRLIDICKKGPLDANNKHIPWNVGDAITYWSVDGAPGESYQMYGHAQLYSGPLTGKGNWTTDNKYNYNGSFMVYRYAPASTWCAVIFRAPLA